MSQKERDKEKERERELPNRQRFEFIEIPILPAFERLEREWNLFSR